MELTSITQLVSPEDWKTLAVFASIVEIKNFWLVALHSEGRLSGEIPAREMHFHIDSYGPEKAFLDPADKTRFLVHVSTTVRMFRGPSEETPREQSETEKPEEPFASIKATYAAEYAIPPTKTELPQVVLDLFARTNGIYNCWPYLRQIIQAISGCIGSAITLPALRIAQEPPPRVNAENESPQETSGDHS